jgi:hypothetical protein
MQPDDWQAIWTAVSTIDFFGRLGTIKVPVRVIAGELDQPRSRHWRILLRSPVRRASPVDAGTVNINVTFKQLRGGKLVGR